MKKVEQANGFLGTWSVAALAMLPMVRDGLSEEETWLRLERCEGEGHGNVGRVFQAKRRAKGKTPRQEGRPVSPGAPGKRGRRVAQGQVTHSKPRRVDFIIAAVESC